MRRRSGVSLTKVSPYGNLNQGKWKSLLYMGRGRGFGYKMGEKESGHINAPHLPYKKQIKLVVV